MALHKDLTGADLHEPKGIVGSASGSIYVSNGAGTGTWKKIGSNEIDTTSIQNPNTVYIPGRITDVSTASVILIPAPENSILLSVRMFLGGTITAANSTIKWFRNDGSSHGADTTITFAGSVEGTSFLFTPTLNTNYTNPGYLKVQCMGGSTGAQPLYLLAKFLRTLP